MDILIQTEKGEYVGPSNPEMLEDLSKSFTRLATSSHELDLRRRRDFKSELKDIYKPLCADNNPVTQLLFGNDLEKETKELTDKRKAVVTKSYPNTKQLYRYKPYPFLGQGYQTNNLRNQRVISTQTLLQSKLPLEAGSRQEPSYQTSIEQVNCLDSYVMSSFLNYVQV